MRKRWLMIAGLGAGSLTATSAHAWKPITHAHLAQQAVNDLLENNGVVTIEQLDEKGEVHVLDKYPALPEVYAAIKDHPAIFYNGVIGPDAFPDLLTGQNIIHPPEPEGTSTNYWWQKMWDATRSGAFATPANRAFMMGMFAHGAGDMFAHSLVNSYTGGPFALDMNAAQHIVTEGYFFQHTPPLGLHQGKDLYKLVADQGMNKNLASFVRTVLDPYTGLSEKAGTGYKKSLPWHFGKLRKGLIDTKDSFQRDEQRWRSELAVARAKWAKINGFKHPIDKAAAGANFTKAKFNDAVLGALVRHAIVPYLNAWIADIDEGLEAWPQVSHRIGQALMFKNPADKTGPTMMDVLSKELSDYWLNYGMRMLGAPDAVSKAAGKLRTLVDMTMAIVEKAGAPFKAFSTKLKKDSKEFLKWVIKEQTGFDVDQWKDYWLNPAKYIDVLYRDHKHPNAKKETTVTVAYLNKLMGLKSTDHVGNEPFDYRKFPPAFNTVNMIKLSFLGPEHVNKIISKLHGYPELTAPNVMLGGWLGSLDAGNQWVHGKQLVFAQQCSLFRKLFKSHDVPTMSSVHEKPEPCFSGGAGMIGSGTRAPSAKWFQFQAPAEIELAAGNNRRFDFGGDFKSFAIELNTTNGGTETSSAALVGTVSAQDKKGFTYTAPAKVDGLRDVDVTAKDDDGELATVRIHLTPPLAVQPAVEAAVGGDAIPFSVNTTKKVVWRVKEGRGRFGDSAKLETLKTKKESISADLAKLNAPIKGSFLEQLQGAQARAKNLPKIIGLKMALEKLRTEESVEMATYYAPTDAKAGEKVTVVAVIGRGNKEGDRTITQTFELVPKDEKEEAELAKQMKASETLESGLKDAAALEKEAQGGKVVLLTNFKPFKHGDEITNVTMMRFNPALVKTLYMQPAVGGGLAPSAQPPSSRPISPKRDARGNRP